MIQTNLFTKHKYTHRHRKQIYGYQKEGRQRDKLGDWETHTHTPIQNLWDAAKAVLRGNCIAVQAFLKKEGKS